MSSEPHPSAKDQRGPIAWMAKNVVTANLLMVMVMLAGVVGLFGVKQEVFPEFNLDLVRVTVPYPGASPSEVEQGINLAVEEEVRGVDGVKHVTSSASEGAGTVVVELVAGTDANKALADVKSAVDRIITFPEDAEKPLVALVSRRRQVISVAISGDQDLATLHAVAEKARAGLLDNPDVTQVEVQGVPRLEVAVEVRRETLESYGLTLDGIAQQIRRASLELPGGEIETRGGELLIRLSDRRRTSDEFANIVLRGTEGGAEVRLGDVATIKDGYTDDDRATFFDGKPAIQITAYRLGKETPKSVAAAVRGYLEELRAELPDNVQVTVLSDDSERLTERLDLLVRNARLGLILVLVVLALFLRIRLAGWVALGIPISFLGALAAMPGTDLSINMVTSFAFIVTLGIVVDDAIIVGENIYTKLQAGRPPLEAAIEGAREMAVPITFAVLTTVVAFSPLFFVPGVIGKIFKLIPSVVCLVLIVSLLESFFILPAHLGHSKPTRSGFLMRIDRLQQRVADGLEWLIVHTYRPVLARVLRYRYMALAAGIGCIVLTVGIVGSGLVPFSFFPKLEGDRVTAAARLPYGSSEERALEVRRILEKSARSAIEQLGGNQDVRGVVTMLGESRAGGGPNPGMPEVGSHVIGVDVNLVAGEKRDFTAAEFSKVWAQRTPRIAGLRSLTFNHSTGPGAGAAVDVQLVHTDTAVLARASEELAGSLREYRALTNIENSYSTGKPQLDFHLLPQARTLGLTGNDVARQLRGAFFGAEALREQRGRNEVRVMVRLPEDQRTSEYDLERLRIKTPEGGDVPLAYVAKFERTTAPTVINREDGKRVVNVRGELAPGVKSPREVLSSLEASVLPELRKAHPGLKTNLVGAQRTQGEAFRSLGKNYVLALFAIFALLAIPFKSYSQPSIVMAAIPFGIVGAVLGHLVMGFEMSIISMFGVIALSGVVVNDSLVLIDATNKFRASGMSAYDAVVAGGQRRFRPILLTSLTTFLGLAPMIAETSVQARFLIPMAISLGFGILFATFIILLLVPALYLLLEDARSLFRREASPPPPDPMAAPLPGE